MTQQDDLVKRLRLDDLPPDQQKEAIENILEIVHKRVGNRVFQVLDEQQLVDLNNLMENEPENSEKLLHWLEKNVPGYSSIVDEELEKLIKDTNDMVDKVMGGK